MPGHKRHQRPYDSRDHQAECGQRRGIEYGQRQFFQPFGRPLFQTLLHGEAQRTELFLQLPPQQLALACFCQALLSSNRFLYVD